MPAIPIVRIEMFGGLRVHVGGKTVERFATQKAAGLLAYLAHHRQLQPRELLIELFWPDGLQNTGRASLSQALSTLRRQLEPPGVPSGGVIVSSKSHVGLNPEAVQTDVGRFQVVMQRSRQEAGRNERLQLLREAVEIYRGDLLPGFYEDWIVNEQQWLAGLYFEAVEALIQLLEGQGDLHEALEYALRAVDRDPLREESHRRVMRLYAATGQRKSALAQLTQLKEILHRELADEPTQATLLLARSVEEMLEVPAAADPAPSRRRSAGKGLPRGTVTFLMAETDGTDQDGASELLRPLLRGHDGHEVKVVDNSVLAAFEAASDAVSGAIDGQKAVAGAKVRIAVHTGEVKLERGEYRGPSLQHVSRLLTAAHSGQIVCSESTVSLLRRESPTGVRFVDLGVFRLRDVPVPEKLFQVNYDGMPQTDFPPPKAEAGYQSNLPLQFTRFFGREEQLAQLSEMLQSIDSRLVDITGSGGTGKTRLALEAGNRLLGAFAGAVWFVPLVDLTDARLIAGAIVDSMRIARTPTSDPLDQAVEALSRQPSLLILDNLEQFVEEGGRVIQTLLERVPSLTILATSRQSLNLAGEREYRLSPLATPNGTGTPERLTMFESVRLFVDRAQAVRPDFQVTNQNAPAVAELCDRLEGIPLAIELAAARASIFGPAQMLLQLERRFDFLVSRRRDTTERHRTLRATMDWSYQLLPPEVQRFFTCLSVFRGGWTFDSAQGVCDEPNATECLQHLQECSLVVSEETPRGIRFRMTETIREYSRELLQESGEAPRLRRRHREYFVDLAQTLKPEMAGPNRSSTIGTLGAEQENLRCALDGCVDDPDAGETGMALVCALADYWLDCGYLAEGVQRCEAALAHLGAQDATKERAATLNALAQLEAFRGQFALGRVRCEESLAISRRLDARVCLARSLHILGIITSNTENLDEARLLFDECIGICDELGDMPRLIAASINLGSVAARLKDFKTARAVYEESIEKARLLGLTTPLLSASLSLGLVVLWQGQTDRARTLFIEVLAVCRETGSRMYLPEALEGLAQASVALENPERAARYYGVAESLRREYELPRDPVTEGEVREPRAAACDTLGEAEFRRLWEEGRAMTLDEAFAYAFHEESISAFS